MKRFALLCLLALTPVLAPAAKVYRWVDAGGQVHYGQIPPSSGKFDAIQTGRETPAPAAEAAEAPVQVDETAKFLREVDAANKAEAEAKAKARDERAQAEKKCSDARARVAFLDERTPRRLATTNPDGSYTRMDEDEFARRRAAAQKEIDTHCR